MRILHYLLIGLLVGSIAGIILMVCGIRADNPLFHVIMIVIALSFGFAAADR